MQLPLESEVIQLIFDYFAPVHASSLSISESVDPDSFNKFSLESTIEQNPGLYHTTNKTIQKTDLLFVASSDLYHNINKLLFYLSSLNPGGIAIIETDSSKSSLNYKDLIPGTGMRIIFAGRIKNLPITSLPDNLKSHSETIIIVVEKLLQKARRHLWPMLTILLANPEATQIRWQNYINQRSLQDQVEIIGWHNSLSDNTSSQTHNPQTLMISSNAAKDNTQQLVRSCLCMTDARFILLDMSGNQFVPCDEMPNMLLTAFKVPSSKQTPLIIQATGTVSDQVSGAKIKTIAIPYQLWNRSCAEYFFEHSAWSEKQANWNKPAQYIKQAKGKIIMNKVRLKNSLTE